MYPFHFILMLEKYPLIILEEEIKIILHKFIFIPLIFKFLNKEIMFLSIIVISNKY